MTFGKLKRKIAKLNEIIKLPTGDYSKEDDNLINEISLMKKMTNASQGIAVF